jgi:hypothetical protein
MATTPAFAIFDFPSIITFEFPLNHFVNLLLRRKVLTNCRIGCKLVEFRPRCAWGGGVGKSKELESLYPFEANHTRDFFEGESDHAF